MGLMVRNRWCCVSGLGGMRCGQQSSRRTRRARRCAASARRSGTSLARPSMLLPVICSSCAACVHQGDNRTTASTTTLRTTVAIAATSMLEIRLVMRHFWRQLSDRLDLDQAVSGGAPGARGGVAHLKDQAILAAGSLPIIPPQFFNRQPHRLLPVAILPIHPPFDYSLRRAPTDRPRTVAGVKCDSHVRFEAGVLVSCRHSFVHRRHGWRMSKACPGDVPGRLVHRRSRDKPGKRGSAAGARRGVALV
jgi:hypothetical protein